MKIQWAETPNKSGRNGKKPIAIVNHITSGNHPGCLSWMRNPQAGASAHYLVTRAGEIFQMVKDEDASWHAGVVDRPNWPLYDGTNPNRRTIGIEHEGYKTNGGDGNLTEAQYRATLWLHKQLVAKWGISVDRDYIIGHYRIDSVNRPNCPGPKFPWDRLFQDLAGTRGAKISVGGKVLDGVILNDNLTYAPVRAFGGALGFPVVWDPQKGVTIGGIKVDVKVINGTSYAPVRYLAESLGKTVTWDGTKVVIV